MKYKQYSYYGNRKRLNMKKVALVTIPIVIVLIAVFIFIGNKPDNDDQNTFDTTLLGDASIDPENVDHNENGSHVESENLVEEQGRTNGIDVSKWQGKIDWKKVKRSNIDFAFIRIGYRGENGTIYKDDNADYNIQQAIKNDVLVGVYFFSTAVNEQEAIEEAKWTLQAIKGYSISYPVVYDCEGFKNSESRMYSLSNEQRTNNALAFLKTVKDAKYDAMFYGSLSDIQNDYHWNMESIEKNYKVWVAQYSTMTYPQKDKPDYNGKYHAWQFTNKGKVSGVSGNVDMVVCYFENDKAKPKDTSATPSDAKAPLTDEEKIYTSVNETVTAKDITNLRESPTTKSDIVASLKNGETLTRIGIGTNGWSKLKYNNKTVYAISSYLTTDLTIKKPEVEKEDIVAGNTFEAKKDKVTAKDVVNLRTLPTTDSEVVGQLKSGDFLQRTAISNKGWSRLTYNGQTVYAISSYLSNEVIKVENKNEEVSDGFTKVNEEVTAKEATNLRTSPSTSDSSVVYQLKNGEYIKRIGINSSTGWSKLEYNGQTVYAISSYLLVKE